MAGAAYLESEGFRAMTGPETVEGELPDEHGTRHRTPASDGELAIVTVNVDSIGWYEASAKDRMEQILDEVLAVTPHMLLLQEVSDEMYDVVKRRLKDWSVTRRLQTKVDHFLVIAVDRARAADTTRFSSYGFSGSSDGRHILTARQDGWAVVNVHAESGGGLEETDDRGSQLKYMSRLHEREGTDIAVLAGDFNVREGEDHCLRIEGWRDVWLEARGIDVESPQEEWTWRRGSNRPGDMTAFILRLAALRL